jgi:hypothetical protein
MHKFFYGRWVGKTNKQNNMKPFIICSILCLLLCGKLYGQEAVTDAPGWFFNPEESMYAGISLPGNDFDRAQQQAVYVALLSYALQNETQVHYRRLLRDIDGHCDFLYEYILPLPDRYRIIKTAVNQYGEIFVGIAVNDGVPPYETVMVSVRNYEKMTLKSEDKEQEHSGRLTFFLKDTVPYYAFSLFATIVTENDSLYAEARTKWVTAAGSEKMDWKSDRDYSYSNYSEEIIPVLRTENAPANYNDNDVPNREKVLPELSSSRLKISLGAAYLASLLDGMDKACSEVSTESISSQPGLSSGIIDDIIVKPAKAIRMAIKNGGLYLLHDSERPPEKRGKSTEEVEKDSPSIEFDKEEFQRQMLEVKEEYRNRVNAK